MIRVAERNKRECEHRRSDDQSVTQSVVPLMCIAIQTAQLSWGRVKRNASTASFQLQPQSQRADAELDAVRQHFIGTHAVGAEAVRNVQPELNARISRTNSGEDPGCR